MAKAPNKRSLMIKGSQWVAKEDFDLVIKYNVYTPKSPTEYYGGKYSLGTFVSLKVKKGAVFTITGKKFFTDLLYVPDMPAEFVTDVSVPKDSVDIVYSKPVGQSGGQDFAPVVDGDTVHLIVQYNSIAPYVDQQGEAETQHYWVIRDTATGEYYRTTGYDKAPFEMEAKSAKAKKHTDLGKVKTTILNFCGYYDGLDDFGSNTADWVGNNSSSNGRTVAMPDTFVAVKFEKFTHAEVETVPLKEWYDNTWRLRTLTKKYGQSVRAVYKKLEEAKKLSTNQYIVNFRTVTQRGSKYDHAEITPQQVTDLETALKTFDVKKPVKAKGVFDWSVAAETVSDAVALKLLSTSLNVTVIDLSKMQEEVS